MYKDTFDHSIKDRQENISSEAVDYCPSSANSNPEITGESGSSSSDSERQVEVISRGNSGKSNFSGRHINETKSLSSSAKRSSSSSSSESSSDDDFSRMEEAFKFTESDAATLASKSGKDYLSSSENSSKSELDNGLFVPTSTYEVCDSPLSQKGMSPTASPPIQVMDRAERYDPSRIPSSVFERNSGPLEWSITSNDSLFSIQLAQPSLSREKMLMYDEMSKSGKLTKSDELVNMYNRAPSFATLEDIDPAKKNAHAENLHTTEKSLESFKLKEGPGEDNNQIGTVHQNASYKSSKSSASSLSHKSGSNADCVASPVKKRGRTSCYCSNCSWVFCYRHTWPSCKCSNCCWVFSCCWNRNSTKYHDHANPILTEEERKDSTKASIPRQESLKEELDATKQEPEATSNSSANCCSWFHCFSCPSCTWKLSYTSSK